MCIVFGETILLAPLMKRKKHGQPLPLSLFSRLADYRDASSGMRARRSVLTGYDAGACVLRIDPRAGTGRDRKIVAVCSLRATSPAPPRRLADVSWQRLDQFCGLGCRSNDRERCSLAGRSTASLPSMLASLPKAG